MASSPHRLLQPEDQAGADGLDDGRRAALLAVGGIGQIVVLVGADVGHGAATGDRRHPVLQQGALDHQHAGSAGSADELVRRDEEGVLGRRAGPASGPSGFISIFT